MRFNSVLYPLQSGNINELVRAERDRERNTEIKIL